jgi:hypothetical protein
MPGPPPPYTWPDAPLPNLPVDPDKLGW